VAVGEGGEVDNRRKRIWFHTTRTERSAKVSWKGGISEVLWIQITHLTRRERRPKLKKKERQLYDVHFLHGWKRLFPEMEKRKKLPGNPPLTRSVTSTGKRGEEF